jgi:hypothetical protein
MTQIQLHQLIEDMCNEAGKKRGIKFRWPAKIGTQVGGEWEVNEFSTTQGGLNIILTYWRSPASPDQEEVFLLLLDLPVIAEQKEEFINKISEKIDVLYERTQR